MISSRIDPALALQRLRLAGSLTEIRGSDLAFTPDEARPLTDEEIARRVPTAARLGCEKKPSVITADARRNCAAKLRWRPRV